MSTGSSLTILQRFGLGPRADGRRHSGSVEDDLLRQLADPAAALIKNPSLPSSADGAQLFVESRVQRIVELAAANRSLTDRETMSMSDARASPSNSEDMAGAPSKSVAGGLGARPPRLYLQDEFYDRIDRAIQSDTPLVERMAMYWLSHFTVSITNPRVTFFAGSFEREAIRPHMFKRFSDLVVAACLDPGDADLSRQPAFGRTEFEEGAARLSRSE